MPKYQDVKYVYVMILSALTAWAFQGWLEDHRPQSGAGFMFLLLITFWVIVKDLKPGGPGPKES